MAITFAALDHLQDREKIIVPMNAVRMALWPPETTVRYLATGGLNSCTAIAIISAAAGILAHIAPLPPGSTQRTLVQSPNASLENARILLQVVASLYQAHRAKFAPGQSYVVAGIFNTQPAMPDVVRLIQQFLNGLHLPVIWKSYPVITDGPRPSGYSSVIIHAEHPGVMPIVYINDQRVN